MKHLIIALLALVQIHATAQTVDPTTRFKDFSPTVLENEEKVAQIFQGMESDFRMLRPWKFQFGSECSQRANTWAYELNQVQNIQSQKVFVFYTIAYHQYYRKTQGKKFIWWFHVAPYVLTQTTNGVEERVLDKTFSDSPLSMKAWTDIFIKSKEACIENVPFKNFEGDVTGNGASYNPNAHCYIVRAPMYDMFPGDIEAREQGLKSEMEFDMNQVQFASKALTVRARKAYLKRVGLKLD